MDIWLAGDEGKHEQDRLENLEGTVHEGQAETDGGVDAGILEDKEQMGVLVLVDIWRSVLMVKLKQWTPGC